MSVELGQKYTDQVTGFEGVATARSEFLNGCVRVLLEGEVREGKCVEYWFDDDRLIKSSKVKPLPDPPRVASSKRGGPGPTPPTRDPRR